MNDKMKQFELDVYETIEKLTNGNTHPYSARIAIIESAKRAFYTPAVSDTVCDHPRENRIYVGRNTLRCGICGAEFE